MGTVTILPETTKNPITLMGARAGCCWNANISDDEKNYKRGLDCIKSGHGRVMEYVNVEMIIDGLFDDVVKVVKFVSNDENYDVYLNGVKYEFDY